MIGPFDCPHFRWEYTPASIEKVEGPVRVAEEEPPEDWKPMPFLGFK